jgi:hypothetical protein
LRLSLRPRPRLDVRLDSRLGERLSKMFSSMLDTRFEQRLELMFELMLERSVLLRLLSFRVFFFIAFLDFFYHPVEAKLICHEAAICVSIERFFCSAKNVFVETHCDACLHAWHAFCFYV